MKAKNNCVMLVKFYSEFAQSAVWKEYRFNRGRDLDKVFGFFVNRKSFRFAIVFKYDKRTKQRLHQVGYFDKKGYDFSNV